MCQFSLHAEFQLPIMFCTSPTEHKDLLYTSQNQSSLIIRANMTKSRDTEFHAINIEMSLTIHEIIQA